MRYTCNCSYQYYDKHSCSMARLSHYPYFCEKCQRFTSTAYFYFVDDKVISLCEECSRELEERARKRGKKAAQILMAFLKEKKEQVKLIFT